MQVFRFVPIQLGEGSAAPGTETKERIQLLRTGIFHHAEYGKFEITAQMLSEMVKNFRARVRGVDIAIDYAHESDKVAAAWIVDLELGGANNEELWAKVKWTPAGAQKLADREYRYLSADFTFDYQDNESLVKFGPVLLGAGLTNRPVVKNMAPAIELSEGRETDTMDPKDKQIADQAAQIAELQKQIEAMKAEKGESPDLADMKQKLADMEKKCSDAEAKLGEIEGAKKKLEEEKALSEKTAKFDKLLGEGKVVEAQREPFLAGDAMKLAELAHSVKLGAEGSGKEAPAATVEPKTKEEAEAKILALAEEKIKNNSSLELGEAISQVRKENSKLVELSK